MRPRSFQRSIYVSGHIFFPSLFWAFIKQFYFMLNDISLTCFSRDEYLGLFKLPAIINNTAMVFPVYVPLLTPGCTSQE